MAVEVDVETVVDGRSEVVVNGRKMSLHKWIWSVEARLAAAGMTLEALDLAIEKLAMREEHRP